MTAPIDWAALYDSSGAGEDAEITERLDAVEAEHREDQHRALLPWIAYHDQLTRWLDDLLGPGWRDGLQ